MNQTFDQDDSKPLMASNRVEIQTEFSNLSRYLDNQENHPPIKEYNIKETNDKEDKKVKYIVHKIEYTDTMDGLALQYNVSAREIMIFNDLTTSDVYYLKEIKIPNPDLQNLHETDLDFDVEEMRKRTKMKTMRELMDPRDHKAAQFYLDDNGWDVNRAMNAYNQDIEFEKRYHKLTDKAKYQEKIRKKLL